ncbi:hypothetical protein TraAM80_09088 [Trypanosoma rangeli]|uniref:Uncharacterized protein n=1 Tax=Trypanosoma rangeli TaxID=5698 RepID=A0A422MXE3_TRYRA|nr:uncharacterized protein TraAM80_09088 [Trypanosoma rangeli]RNE97873.1 hypothetical protein TraAM80_09088 [Trypanosoma rangeli]|eukprot:RNE97873.1 hypothetical protein TraAM80_09088 [Trypanosoma rangeli]
MSQQGHLGILCVDVSEVLKANERRKVERRENMVLYNGSYLITGPVPLGTPRSSSVARTPSNSVARGSSVNSSVKMSDQTPQWRRRRSSRWRRHKKTSSIDKEDHHHESSGDEAMPPITSPCPARRRKGKRIVEAGHSSVVGPGKQRLPVRASHDRSQSAGSSFSAWRRGQQHYALMDRLDVEPLKPIIATPAALSHNEPHPKQQDPREHDKHPRLSLTQSRQKEREIPRSHDSTSPLSDSAGRGLDCVLESLQWRAWQNSPMSYRPLLNMSRTSDYHRQDERRDLEEDTRSGSPSRVDAPVTAVGGGTTLQTWGSPLSLHKKSAVRHVKAGAEMGLHSCLIRDSRGTERVVLLGVVPTLPRPVAQFPPVTRGMAAGRTLPPAVRRAARVVAEPTRRPKRF